MDSLINVFDVLAHCHKVQPHPVIRASCAQEKSLSDRAFCAEVGRIAIVSLYDELSLYPKPGLVSLVDNGSHDDMTAETFLRSLFSLRHYFVRMAEAGMRQQSFFTLKHLGIAAEKRMMLATGGVNTHRGAIFAVGLLCASAGVCRAQKTLISASSIRAALVSEWGAELLHHAQDIKGNSHGIQVANRYAASGAREEAALGMPSVFEIALPMLKTTLGKTDCWERARIDALFALMASVSDTNVYYRGGSLGAQMVKTCARDFLARGGTGSTDWREYAISCHRRFTEKKLSPGGAADLLGATCFVFRVEKRMGRHSPPPLAQGKARCLNDDGAGQ
ncbi:triphosphoribosyl-dephospho-CoA synthase MdcB [Noviherbaspirillum sp. Root189]|uniref:triphosphoribosyl-dephospho-CoA synthase MdcB n=1 Tax=Noviherbaspirillum sp. Root189 TaxID=1736487 RepID=UPI0009E70C7B|nr:triphosphoribosyl-dephospho-CoA synthase MdcB [Noviherbaspirillum sp. Root189]